MVIPEGGVSTGQAYSTFDESPQPIPADAREQAERAKRASHVPIFNNLAPASEQVLPELAEVRAWAQAADGISDVLLSGSGSATFCVCDDMQTAFGLAVDARAKGWVTRVTSFSSMKATILPRRQGTNLGATRV